jgi:hypothetical protein
MKAVKVDSTKRIRLPSLVPGDLYEPQVGPDIITLRRIPHPKRKWTRSEVVRAINKSRLKFFRSWEEVRADTREL